MSAFQFRIWKKMTALIQDFYAGKILFHPLVKELLKDLEEAKLEDKDLVRKWYDYFYPLEEADSEDWYEMKDFDFERVNPSLQKMKEFMLEQEQNLALPAAQHRKPAHVRHA